MTRRTRRGAAEAARWAAACGIALVVSLAGAGALGAAAEIGLSRDGVTWSERLAEPLFDPGLRWVPGDRRTAEFHVRNQTSDPALLAVELTTSAPDDLVVTGDLTITARTPGGTSTAADAPGTTRLVTDAPLAPGAALPVSVTVEFDAGSPNRSQGLALTFGLRVVLTQDTGAAPPTSTTLPPAPTPTASPVPTPRPAPSTVPSTGAAHVPELVGAASFLVVLGGLTARAARRRPHRG